MSRTMFWTNIYYTLIYPYLIYCNLVWGGAASVHLNKLLLLQKKGGTPHNEQRVQSPLRSPLQRNWYS